MEVKVVELFAGVGGFRIGLEGYPKKKDTCYSVIWSNQFEPSTKKQHANEVYIERWGSENHCGDDIATVSTEKIPDHDLLVGGFPCQDYSVATTLKRSEGLQGKKGVLWWQIHRILKEKEHKTKYIVLENVDRLLKSPASQRGRDFAIMLASLNELGYAVEWKVINAAEYGMPQRRRRVFIVGYHKTTNTFKRILRLKDKEDWLLEEGVLPRAFPSYLSEKSISTDSLSKDLVEISNEFNKGQKLSPFKNSGIMIGGQFWTCKTKPNYLGEFTVLKDIIQKEEEIPVEFYINSDDIDKWKYLKGAKNEERYNKAKDFHYKYNEGSMIFPDDIENSSRTIITGEGGKSPSRFKHVIKPNGKLRRLIPLELERLNMFPDHHTKKAGITDAKRAFFMGNALVVGVVEKIGNELIIEINK